MKVLNSFGKAIILGAIFIPPLIVLFGKLRSPINDMGLVTSIIVLLLGAPISFLLSILYRHLETSLKRRRIIPILTVVLFIGAIPLNFLINKIQKEWFLFLHQKSIEQIAVEALNKEIDLQEANNLLKSREIDLKINGGCNSIDSVTVFFSIKNAYCSGYGFAYSLTEKEPENVIRWDKFDEHWFEWTRF